MIFLKLKVPLGMNMDTGNSEMFNLSYKVLGNDKPITLHIVKE